MSMHINRFIDRVRAADTKGQRDIVISLADAKNLHADITKLLLAVQEMHDRMSAAGNNNQVINVEVEGGSF
jgi:hypothetical protein